MASGNSRSLVVLLVALIGAAALFIPFARFLDSILPGPHMGFGLIGVWFYWIVPGSFGLAIGTLVVGRRTRADPRWRSRFVRGAALVYALFFLACLIGYRLMW